MTKPGYIYLCTSGHVDMVPAMGTYASCCAQVQLRTRNGQVGSAPCNAPIVEVPDADGSLEGAYRVGGREAVMSIVAERIASHGEPAAQGASIAPQRR